MYIYIQACRHVHTCIRISEYGTGAGAALSMPSHLGFLLMCLFVFFLLIAAFLPALESDSCQTALGIGVWLVYALIHASVLPLHILSYYTYCNVCIYKYMSIYIYIRICIYVYIWTYVYIYIYVYMYICI